MLHLSSNHGGTFSEGLHFDVDQQGNVFNRGQVKVRARLNSAFVLTKPMLVSLISSAA
jgi:hypothetical protein